MQRDELLNRYRHLRAISTGHQSAALGCLARPAIMEQARHLGLSYGQRVIVDSEEEMTLIFDLAVYSARRGRTRAIDRYAKVAALADASDEALALDAMRQARFSVWEIKRRHEVAGLIVTDLLRDGETWLVDEGMAESGEPGTAFAGRLCWPAEFAITCGVVVPVDTELMGEVILDSVTWARNADPDQLADDPRFAAAIYRHALEGGMMEGVEYREVARPV